MHNNKGFSHRMTRTVAVIIVHHKGTHNTVGTTGEERQGMASAFVLMLAFQKLKKLN